MERSINVRTGPTAVLVYTTIRNLLPNREYTVRVRAVNVVGSGIFSDTLMFQTKRTGNMNYISSTFIILTISSTNRKY